MRKTFGGVLTCRSAPWQKDVVAQKKMAAGPDRSESGRLPWIALVSFAKSALFGRPTLTLLQAVNGDVHPGPGLSGTGWLRGPLLRAFRGTGEALFKLPKVWDLETLGEPVLAGAELAVWRRAH